MHGPAGRFRRGIAAAGVVVVTATLAGCGGVGTAGSTGGFVNSQHGITLVPVAERRAAPELAGLDLSGQKVSTRQLRGDDRVLVVNVWGSWCAPCRREAPVLAAAARRYAAEGVAFVGLLSRDKPAAASAFARRFDLSYPSLQDPGGRLQLRFADSLPSQGIPTTWIIDRHGRVAARVMVEVTKGTLDGLIDDELARR